MLQLQAVVLLSRLIGIGKEIDIFYMIPGLELGSSRANESFGKMEVPKRYLALVLGPEVMRSRSARLHSK